MVIDERTSRRLAKARARTAAGQKPHGTPPPRTKAQVLDKYALASMSAMIKDLYGPSLVEDLLYKANPFLVGLSGQLVNFNSHPQIDGRAARLERRRRRAKARLERGFAPHGAPPPFFR